RFTWTENNPSTCAGSRPHVIGRTKTEHLHGPRPRPRYGIRIFTGSRARRESITTRGRAAIHASQRRHMRSHCARWIVESIVAIWSPRKQVRGAAPRRREPQALTPAHGMDSG